MDFHLWMFIHLLIIIDIHHILNGLLKIFPTNKGEVTFKRHKRESSVDHLDILAMGVTQQHLHSSDIQQLHQHLQWQRFVSNIFQFQCKFDVYFPQFSGHIKLEQSFEEADIGKQFLSSSSVIQSRLGHQLINSIVPASVPSQTLGRSSLLATCIIRSLF